MEQKLRRGFSVANYGNMSSLHCCTATELLYKCSIKHRGLRVIFVFFGVPNLCVTGVIHCNKATSLVKCLLNRDPYNVKNPPYKNWVVFHPPKKTAKRPRSFFFLTQIVFQGTELRQPSSPSLLAPSPRWLLPWAQPPAMHPARTTPNELPNVLII